MYQELLKSRLLIEIERRQKNDLSGYKTEKKLGKRKGNERRENIKIYETFLKSRLLIEIK